MKINPAINQLSMLSKLPPAVCLGGGGGGGGGGATGLLNKGGGATGYLWNFHRYRLVYNITLSTPWLTPHST